MMRERERERERERATNETCYDCELGCRGEQNYCECRVEESWQSYVLVTLRRIHGHSISLDTIFRKN